MQMNVNPSIADWAATRLEAHRDVLKDPSAILDL